MVQRGATGEELRTFVPNLHYSNIVVGTIKEKLDSLFFLRQTSLQFRTDVAAMMGKCACLRLNALIICYSDAFLYGS